MSDVEKFWEALRTRWFNGNVAAFSEIEPIDQMVFTSAIGQIIEILNRNIKSNYE